MSYYAHNRPTDNLTTVNRESRNAPMNIAQKLNSLCCCYSSYLPLSAPTTFHTVMLCILLIGCCHENFTFPRYSSTHDDENWMGCEASLSERCLRFYIHNNIIHPNISTCVCSNETTDWWRRDLSPLFCPVWIASCQTRTNHISQSTSESWLQYRKDNAMIYVSNKQTTLGDPPQLI